MFIIALCATFLMKPQWLKNKSLYERAPRLENNEGNLELL